MNWCSSIDLNSFQRIFVTNGRIVERAKCSKVSWVMLKIHGASPLDMLDSCPFEIRWQRSCSKWLSYDERRNDRLFRAHYGRVCDEPAYVVPYDQLKLNLACVYYHFDQQYYRAFIEFMDEKSSNGSRIIEVRLVDYGVSVDNISYYPQSTFLKFLHEDFAHVATEIYDCRLANLDLPPGKETWPVEAKETILRKLWTIHQSYLGWEGPRYLNERQHVHRGKIASNWIRSTRSLSVSTIPSSCPSLYRSSVTSGFGFSSDRLFCRGVMVQTLRHLDRTCLLFC